MAVRLTPLARGLVAIIILGGAVAMLWNLGLKELVAKVNRRVQNRSPAAAVPAATAPPPDSGRAPPLGSAARPLMVSIASSHGHAPALMANGGSVETRSGSIFDEQGVHVAFKIGDRDRALLETFQVDGSHCASSTSDAWARQQPRLRKRNLDARAIMVASNTQGGDAIIARDPEMRRVEDLASKRIALLRHTRSHSMVVDAVESSCLSPGKRASIDYVFTDAGDGSAGVRAAFEAGDVDAAALWDPDLSRALRALPNAHAIYSTETATNLIYDVIVCDARILDDPSNLPALQAFVAGWLAGVAVAERNPESAAASLIRNDAAFAALARKEGKQFIRGLFDNIVWTGLDDNIRVLGLAGGTDHYARVYERFDESYRATAAADVAELPIIDPSQSVDTRFVQHLMRAAPVAAEQAKQPQFEFSEDESRRVAQKTPVVTKPVRIGFRAGSAELSERSQQAIDEEMVPLIENNGSAYFEVSGNSGPTQSTSGTAPSRGLAEAVVEYLVDHWAFEKQRFVVVDSGPDEPLCDELHPEQDDISADECRGLNRSTRVAVLSR